MSIADLALVAAGGAIGATLRYSLGGWLADRLGTSFPWHTLTVNLAGAFALGMLMALSIERGAIGSTWRLFLGTGILGGFTTFSTLAYESMALIGAGGTLPGLANMFGSATLGLIACWLGIVVGRVI